MQARSYIRLFLPLLLACLIWAQLFRPRSAVFGNLVLIAALIARTPVGCRNSAARIAVHCRKIDLLLDCPADLPVWRLICHLTETGQALAAEVTACGFFFLVDFLPSFIVSTSSACGFFLPVFFGRSLTWNIALFPSRLHLISSDVLVISVFGLRQMAFSLSSWSLRFLLSFDSSVLLCSLI